MSSSVVSMVSLEASEEDEDEERLSSMLRGIELFHRNNTSSLSDEFLVLKRGLCA